MKVYAPTYYRKFKCIADKCKHNCCIGWEIDIDNDTLYYYQNLNTDFGKRLTADICLEETPHFRLTEGDRCPFLNECGLCDIITELGEDALCQICTDHPRFRNYYKSRTEIGIGLCCEAAAELILNDCNVFSLVVIDEDFSEEELNKAESNMFYIRDELFKILESKNDLPEKCNRIIDKYALRFSSLEPNYWYEIFTNLERLDNGWNKILENLKTDYLISDTYCQTYDYPLCNVLKYFIFRHFINISTEYGVEEALKFCILSCYVIGYLASQSVELSEIARMYSCEIEYSEQNIPKIIEAL